MKNSGEAVADLQDPLKNVRKNDVTAFSWVGMQHGSNNVTGKANSSQPDTMKPLQPTTDLLAHLARVVEQKEQSFHGPYLLRPATFLQFE